MKIEDEGMRTMREMEKYFEKGETRVESGAIL